MFFSTGVIYDSRNVRQSGFNLHDIFLFFHYSQRDQRKRRRKFPKRRNRNPKKPLCLKNLPLLRLKKRVKQSKKMPNLRALMPWPTWRRQHLMRYVKWCVRRLRVAPLTLSPSCLTREKMAARIFGARSATLYLRSGSTESERGTTRGQLCSLL